MKFRYLVMLMLIMGTYQITCNPTNENVPSLKELASRNIASNIHRYSQDDLNALPIYFIENLLQHPIIKKHIPYLTGTPEYSLNTPQGSLYIQSYPLKMKSQITFKYRFENENEYSTITFKPKGTLRYVKISNILANTLTTTQTWVLLNSISTELGHKIDTPGCFVKVIPPPTLTDNQKRVLLHFISTKITCETCATSAQYAYVEQKIDTFLTALQSSDLEQHVKVALEQIITKLNEKLPRNLKKLLNHKLKKKSKQFKKIF